MLCRFSVPDCPTCENFEEMQALIQVLEATLQDQQELIDELRQKNTQLELRVSILILSFVTYRLILLLHHIHSIKSPSHSNIPLEAGERFYPPPTKKKETNKQIQRKWHLAILGHTFESVNLYAYKLSYRSI